MLLWICGHAATRRLRVLLSEDRSQLQASGIWSNAPMSPKQGLSPCALIKGKGYSLKEKRADDVRREVAWNQERKRWFRLGKCGSRGVLITAKVYPIKQNFRGSHAWKSFKISKPSPINKETRHRPATPDHFRHADFRVAIGSLVPVGSAPLVVG